MTTKKRVELEKHPVGRLVRDERVNRFTSLARVEKLRANLNLDGIGTFVVSHRRNGDLVLLDGAHRSIALIQEGFEDQVIPALVHYGLSAAEEAQLFLVYNDRLAVDILERFRLQIAAEDPESVTLDAIIREAGFQPVSSVRNRLTCIKTLRTVYRGGTSTGRETHTETLRETLRIITEAWGTEGTATKQTILGIGAILLNHKEELDIPRLITALSNARGGANAVAVRTHYHTHEGGKRTIVAAELAVGEIYNKTLKSYEKLKLSA